MALPEPVKRGQVHPRDYQNEEYYSKLQPLVAALGQEVPDAKYDAKSLAFMLVQILHFQEAALGRDAMPPRPCPKLPIRLITDPAVEGALHAIAVKVHEIKRVRGWKAVEWQNPGKKKECMEVVLALRRELERRALLRVPLVHVSPVLGPETQRLREYVRRLQGNLAEGPDEPGVTHIVYPFGSGGDPDDGSEYTTVTAVKGDRVRVHYWYQPDSYDEWIPGDRVDNKEVVPDKQPPAGKWKVTPRWVVDSEKHNEWMNPADYTTPDFDAEMEAADAAGGRESGKRAGGALGGASKKAKTDGSARSEVAVEPLSVLDVHVVTRQLLAPHKGLNDARGISVENLSHGQTDVHMAAYLPAVPPQATPPAAAGDAAAAAGGGGGPSSCCVSAPAYASWFRYDSIHEQERSEATDFFNGRSSTNTPALYRAYRDAIITLYLDSPGGAPLSFATVKQHLDGEVNGLMRIYELLIGWGIINHTPSSSLTAAAAHRHQPRLPVAGRVSTGMPPGTACLFDFQRPSLLEACAAAQAGGIFRATHSSTAAARGDTRGAAPGSLLTPSYGRRGGDVGLNPSVTAKIYCSAMPWVECSQLRYHCTRYPDINLCPAAYAEGRFPPGCSSRDFVRLDAAVRQPSADGWRPEETLLLLEGLELYKEDWGAIAGHVGTRSQAACLQHFVRMPIEDQFVEDIAAWGAPGAGAVPVPGSAPNGSLRPSQDGVGAGVGDGVILPFQDDHNPVMSTVCMLAVLMGPRVAAAAAQRAMQVMVEGDLDAIHDLNVAARIAAGPAAADGVQGQQAAGGSAGDAAGGGSGAAERPVPDPTRPVSKALMLAATAGGLAAAARRCKQLAEQDEREIQRLMVALVDQQQRKVDTKTKLLAEMTQVVERERVAAELNIKQLAQEHATLTEQRKKAQAAKAVQQQQQAVAKQKVAAAQAQQQKAAAAAAATAQKQQQAAAAAAAAQQQQAQAAAKATQQQGLAQQQPDAAQQQVKQEQQQLPQQLAAAAAAAGVQGQQPGLQQPAAPSQQLVKQEQQAMDEDDDDFDMP